MQSAKVQHLLNREVCLLSRYISCQLKDSEISDLDEQLVDYVCVDNSCPLPV